MRCWDWARERGQSTSTNAICAPLYCMLSARKLRILSIQRSPNPNPAGACTNIHILNETISPASCCKILVCKLSLGFFSPQDSPHFNRWTIGSLGGVLVCLFFLEGEKKKRGRVRGRPALRTLKTKNVIPARGDRQHFSRALWKSWPCPDTPQFVFSTVEPPGTPLVRKTSLSVIAN